MSNNIYYTISEFRTPISFILAIQDSDTTTVLLNVKRSFIVASLVNVCSQQRGMTLRAPLHARKNWSTDKRKWWHLLPLTCSRRFFRFLLDIVVWGIATHGLGHFF
ncbi:hypothetical protein K0M31_016145 [Melipona bicolor]|uniref:Uncharacterized protein n=1 Tax=Melipona bicolor TaxID=60889 RepID=A0AA40G775_9HYME|nr:hypothetical protein K0M31_016145 [Melipona bicolor]